MRIQHLDRQGLWGKNTLKLQNIFRKLNYVQIDAAFSVPRSQDMVIHSRIDDYEETQVWNQFNNLKVFEGWSHAKCILPFSHFSYYYADAIDRREKDTWNKYYPKFKDLPLKVLKKIEEEGAKSIADIDIPRGFPASKGWSTARKRIFNYLDYRGYIIGTHTSDFKLIFDIPERIVGQLPDEFPDKLNRFWFYIDSTLDANGITPLHRLLHYKYNHRTFHIQGARINPRKLIDQAVIEGKLNKYIVEDQTYIGRDADFEGLTTLNLDEVPRVHFLSPFDNALWSRESLTSQYGFDYKMEIYVPQKNRVYGYYVLPILYGAKFVGRVDVKLDRKLKILYFIKWSWEKGFKITDEFIQSLGERINKYLRFCNAGKVNLGNLKNKSIQHIIEVDIS